METYITLTILLVVSWRFVFWLLRQLSEHDHWDRDNYR